MMLNFLPAKLWPESGRNGRNLAGTKCAGAIGAILARYWPVNGPRGLQMAWQRLKL